MNSEQPSVAVMFDRESRHQEIPKPRVTWWTWVKYYAWNFYRKPMVWRKQKELAAIAETVKNLVRNDVLPKLYQVRSQCPRCRANYEILKPQIFVSQIELILRQFPCEDHPDITKDFLFQNSHYFTQSEQLAKWINGFAP